MFDLDKPDMKIFASFHEKLQEAIKRSPEWAKQTGREYVPDMADEEIPF
jgi:hypothetical protein